AGAAGLAAVGGRDERDEGGDVRLGGGAETGLHGGGFYGGRRVDARGGKRAAGYGIAAPAATAASGQQPADLLQRGHEGVDLLVRVVERHRRATGRGHAVELQQRVRAVLARAHRHALQVEQGGQVVRVRAVDQERDHRRLLRGAAEDAHAAGRV